MGENTEEKGRKKMMKISQCFVCVRERTNARVPRTRGLVVTLENVFSRCAAKSAFLLVSRAIRTIDGSLVVRYEGKLAKKHYSSLFSLLSLRRQEQQHQQQQHQRQRLLKSRRHVGHHDFALRRRLCSKRCLFSRPRCDESPRGFSSTRDQIC